MISFSFKKRAVTRSTLFNRSSRNLACPLLAIVSSCVVASIVTLPHGLAADVGLSRQAGAAASPFPIAYAKLLLAKDSVTPGDEQAVRADIATEAAFLRQRWPQILDALGKPYADPNLREINVLSQTACGPNAELSYCPADKTVYFDAAFSAAIKKLTAEYAHTNGVYGVQAALAHEWGHAVRAMIGELATGTSGEEAAADCLAGAVTKDAELAGRIQASDVASARFTLALVADSEERDRLGRHTNQAAGIHGLA